MFRITPQNIISFKTNLFCNQEVNEHKSTTEPDKIVYIIILFICLYISKT